MKRTLVILWLMLSAVMMSLAWLGHLRFADTWSFGTALGVSWLIVLPEYALNTTATRWGYGMFSGAQMASMHLCAGVGCVVLVSKFVLGESLTVTQGVGFALMAVAITMVLKPGPSRTATRVEQQQPKQADPRPATSRTPDAMACTVEAHP